MKHDQPGLLILDLDECLIHSSETELYRPADFRIGRFHVYRRPGLTEFLSEVGDRFQLAIWSSATADYVRGIASQICPPAAEWAFVWSRDRCTPKRILETLELVYLKDLKKVRRLGYSLDRILSVDDTPEKVSRNYGNAVYVAEFEGHDADCELALLAKYLTSIAHEPNFRCIEKRGWRSQAARQS